MDRISLQVTLPRGPEHYWRMMVELTRNAGGFTISDIWGLTNSRSRQTLKSYIHACRDAGHLAVIGEAANNAVSYRVVNLNAAAPVQRRPDYRGERGRVRQQMWTTIRGLPRFTIPELIVEASTDEIAVGASSARCYVQALCEAGYLTTIQASARLKMRGVFRLKPNMDSGPKAPAVMKVGFVIDRNRKVALGTALGEAEDVA